MFPTEGSRRVSSLFSARRSPAARLRLRYRRYRSTPRRGLTGPLLLALAIAGAGHQVAGGIDPALRRTTLAAAPSATSATSATDHSRLGLLLGEPVAPAEAIRARAESRAESSAGSVLAARTAQTPARASRSAAKRVAVAKPAVRKPRWTRPTGGQLTSSYGRRWGRMHNGLDFGAPHGAPVRAAFDGVVVSAGYDGGYGKQIRIRHDGGLTTTYSHLSKFVRTGGRVKAGEVVGKVGSTGNSTGPHLHFEILVRGANVNPRPFLATRGVRV